MTKLLMLQLLKHRRILDLFCLAYYNANNCHLQSMKCHTISSSYRFWSLENLIHLRLFIFWYVRLSQWHHLLQVLDDFTVAKLCLRPAIFPNQSFWFVSDPVHRDQGSHCGGRITVDVNWGKGLGKDLFQPVGCLGKSSSAAVLYLDMLAHIYLSVGRN